MCSPVAVHTVEARLTKSTAGKLDKKYCPLYVYYKTKSLCIILCKPFLVLSFMLQALSVVLRLYITFVIVCLWLCLCWRAGKLCAVTGNYSGEGGGGGGSGGYGGGYIPDVNVGGGDFGGGDFGGGDCGGDFGGGDCGGDFGGGDCGGGDINHQFYVNLCFCCDLKYFPHYKLAMAWKCSNKADIDTSAVCYNTSIYSRI